MALDPILGSIYNYNRPPQIAYDLRNQLALSSNPIPPIPISAGLGITPKSVTPVASILDQLSTLPVTQSRGVSPILNFTPGQALPSPASLSFPYTPTDLLPSTFTGNPIAALNPARQAGYAAGIGGVSPTSTALVRTPGAVVAIPDAAAYSTIPEQLALNPGAQRLALPSPSPITYANAADPFAGGVFGGAASTGAASTGAASTGRNFASGARAATTAEGAIKAAATGASETAPLAGEAATAGRLATFLKSPAGKGAATAIGLQVLGHFTNPYLTSLQQQGGTTGHIGGAAKGAIQGASLGAGLGTFIPGVGTALGAGVGGVIGGGLGWLGGGSGSKASTPQSIVAQLSGSNLFSTDELNTLSTLTKAMKDAGNADADIINSFLLPTIQQRWQQQQTQDAYIQQVKDYFDQQNQAIQQSTLIGQALSAPWIDQMRKDADLRQQLYNDAINSSGYPEAYKKALSASQANVASATRAMADSYAQQIRTAPYYGLQQQQAQVLEQLRQQQTSLLPQIQQNPYVASAAAQSPDILAQLLAANGA